MGNPYVNVEAIGSRAENLGIIGVDSAMAALSYYIDPRDKRRIGIVTNTAKAIFTRQQLEAIIAELPEIMRMYGGMA